MPIENYLVHPKMRIKGLQDTHMPIEITRYTPRCELKIYVITPHERIHVI